MDPVLTEQDQQERPAPRRVSSGLLWAAALATVVLAIAVVMSFSFDDSGDADVAKLSLSDPESPLESGETAHDLPGETIPPLSFARFDPTTQTFTSSAGSLLDYRGAPLVINFWASTCAPCIREMPAMQSVADEYADRVAFLGIDQKGDPEDAAVDLIEKTGVTYDLGRDDGNSMVEWFGIAGLPTTIFVQADGTIVDVQTGELDAAQMQQILTEKMGL
jgi:thiol-disulfide isomerase/thioredoxin